MDAFHEHDTATAQKLVFLRYLRMEVGLSYSAILGYRSALNQIFILKGMNLADCKVISGLLRGFRNSCSPRDFAYPPWDLEIVLKYLRDVLEPISSIFIRDLTLNTVFLIALASAKRVSEIHAISKDFSNNEDWMEVQLKPVTSFIAKTQDPSKDDRRFSAYKISSIPVDEKRRRSRLCPVRCLKTYW